MVAQWNIGGVHPTSMSDSGVYMMQSPDGISFTPMFSNRSLGWSDTKNVMFWSAEVAKYVAYIRIDNPSPDPHVDFPCPNPWLYGNFDIILDHLSRIPQLYAALHTPCAVFHLVPCRLIGC